MGRMAKKCDCGASVFIGILQSSIMALSKKIIRNIIKMKLVDLKEGEKGFISVVGGSAAFRLRLEEMGFIPGKRVVNISARWVELFLLPALLYGLWVISP